MRPAHPRRGRRRGATFLEVQVAMVVLCVALAGICPLVVMQSKILRRLESQPVGTDNLQIVRGVRMLDGTPYVGPGQTEAPWTVLQPEPDAWVRRLGTAATFRADAPAQPFAPLAVQAQADDGDPAFVAPGWDATGTDPAAVDGNFHSLAARSPAAPATWSLAAINPGRYHVLVSWVAAPQNATDAAYTIGNGSTQVNTFTVDQTAAPVGTSEGTSWRDSGVACYLSPASTIQLGGSTKGRVVADALLLVPAGPLLGVTVASPPAPTADGSGVQVGVSVAPR